jgi:hypothetical protein
VHGRRSHAQCASGCIVEVDGPLHVQPRGAVPFPAGSHFQRNITS